jgi:hypothetical protein
MHGMGESLDYQESRLLVWLYGKTADLIRTEAATREMGYDRLVQDIIWLWASDLAQDRSHTLTRRDIR